MLPAGSMRGVEAGLAHQPHDVLPAGDVGLGVGDAADAVGERPARRTAEHAERLELLPQPRRVDPRTRRLPARSGAVATTAAGIDAAMV